MFILQNNRILVYAFALVGKILIFPSFDLTAPPLLARLKLMLVVNIGEEFWLKEPFPGVSPGIASNPAYQSLGGFISKILPNIYVIAGVIFFIFLVVGGLTVIMGAGKGESETTKKGGGAIASALIGFLIIFASWWIIQLVETLTGVKIFGNPNL